MLLFSEQLLRWWKQKDIWNEDFGGSNLKTCNYTHAYRMKTKYMRNSRCSLLNVFLLTLYSTMT